MLQLGFTLSSEEHAPSDLVRYGVSAERAGFDFAYVTDHFHPWVPAQGHSPFAWAVLGALAHVTTSIQLGTAVTCPTIRMHPVVVAHASSTVAAMAPGRFTLCVGSGENLNEHVVGDGWPRASERLTMLREAVEIIRDLWTGESISRSGDWFEVDRARLYTRPEQPPKLFVAASGKKSAALAAETDGLIAVGPDEEVIREFEQAGGSRKPRVAMLHCYVSDERDEEAKRKVIEYWPNTAFSAAMHTDLATPEDFESAVRLVRPDDVVTVTVGPDPEPHLDAVRRAVRVGFDRILLHQVGPDQDRFMRFFGEHLAEMRSEGISEAQIDRMVEETFPASDAPSTWSHVG